MFNVYVNVYMFLFSLCCLCSFRLQTQNLLLSFVHVIWVVGCKKLIFSLSAISLSLSKVKNSKNVLKMFFKMFLK